MKPHEKLILRALKMLLYHTVHPNILIEAAIGHLMDEIDLELQK